MARPSTACRRNLTPRTVLLALIFGTLLLMFAHGDIRIVVGRKNEEVLVVGVHRHRQPNVVEAPDDAPDIADDVNPAVVPPPVVVGGGIRARAAASAAAKKPVAGKPIEAPHGGDADHVAHPAAAGAGGSADAANDHDGDGKDDGIVLPPGADWSEADIKSVPYQRTKPVTKRAAGLTQSEQQGFISRMKAGGYVKQHINATAPWPTLKQYPVNSELFLATCDVDSPTYQIDCGVITQMRKEVGLLDIALLNDQGVVKFKAQRKSGPVIGKKLRKRIMKRPGQGLTGRGWGIAGPFTNKWRFYERHLRAALAAEAQRATGAAHRAGETGLHLCEVGFLAGHSVAVYAGIVGRGAFSAVSVFDYPQPGPMYATVGSQHMRSRIEGAAERPGGRRPRFDFYAGNSRDLVPAAVRSGRLRQCDFVSLDGSKMVPDVVSDLRGLGRVAHAGTVVVMDDMWTTKVTAAAKAVAEGGARAVDLGEHNAAVGALVGLGVLEIVEVWHSDVIPWPAYGNLAIRYKLYGDALEAAFDSFLELKFLHMTPLRVNETAVASCDAAQAVGLPAKCCHDDIADVPVNHFSAIPRPWSAVPYKPWPAALKLLKACPAPAAPTGAECHPKLPPPLVNPFDNSLHLVVWAAQQLATSDRPSDAACFVGLPLGEAVPAGAVLRGAAKMTSVIHFDHLAAAGADLAVDNSCKVSEVERRPLDVSAPQPELLKECAVTVFDAAAWKLPPGPPADGGALPDEAANPATRTLLGALHRFVSETEHNVVVVRNVHAAGIFVAAAFEIQRRPRDKAAYKGQHWHFDQYWAPARKRIGDFLSDAAAGTGGLTELEADIAFGVVQGYLYIHAADMPDDPALARRGSVVLGRFAPDPAHAGLLHSVFDAQTVR